MAGAKRSLIYAQVVIVTVVISTYYSWTMASLGAQMVKNLPAKKKKKNLPAVQETRLQSLGREDCLEKGLATHSSILA